MNDHGHAQTKLANDKLAFGATFSDHMLDWNWTVENGWGDIQIHPFRNLSLHPASSVLHYALEV